MSTIKLIKDIMENKLLLDQIVDIYFDDANSIEIQLRSILLATQNLSNLSLFAYRWGQIASIAITDMRTAVGMAIKDALRVTETLGFVMTAAFAAIFQGIDVYYYIKGHMGGSQFALNTTSNVLGLLGGLACIFFASNPIGWVLLGASVLLSISTLFFTSTSTFDDTVKAFFDHFISHNLDNITLPFWLQKKIYDKLQLTDKKLDKNKNFYSVCRQLQSELKDARAKIQLTDENVIARQVAMIIIKSLKENHQKVFSEDQNFIIYKDMLTTFKDSIMINQKTISLYFNRFQLLIRKTDLVDDLSDLLKKLQKEIQDSIEKNKQFECQKSDNYKHYMKDFKQFVQYIEQNINVIDKKDFDQYSDGVFRIDKRFEINCNTFANICVMKQKIQEEQELIDSFRLENDIYVPNDQDVDGWLRQLLSVQIDEKDLIEFSHINALIENRYLTLSQGIEKPSIMSQNKDDIFDTPITWQCDLFDLVKNTVSLDDFLTQAKSLRKQTKNLLSDESIKERMISFYDSYKFLNELKIEN